MELDLAAAVEGMTDAERLACTSAAAKRHSKAISGDCFALGACCPVVDKHTAKVVRPAAIIASGRSLL